jgi:DNA-binding CsgD family transcriptional regulator
VTCAAATFTLAEARDQRKSLSRHWRFPVSVYQCEACDQYHLRANTKNLKISASGLKVLQYTAQGYTAREIESNFGITAMTTNWWIKKLKEAFGANSAPHLVAIVISLSVLDPRTFVPTLTERCLDERSAAATA